MKAIQYAGLVLGAVVIAAQQLSTQLPQQATYFAIAGTVAGAILVALHHQAQADEPTDKPAAAPSVKS